MESLLLLILLVMLFRLFYTETAPPPKPEGGQCKRCKVKLSKGESLCYYCEIIEFRQWKYEQQNKSS